MWRGHRKAVLAGELAAGAPGEEMARCSQPNGSSRLPG